MRKLQAASNWYLETTPAVKALVPHPFGAWLTLESLNCSPGSQHRAPLCCPIEPHNHDVMRSDCSKAHQRQAMDLYDSHTGNKLSLSLICCLLACPRSPRLHAFFWTCVSVAKRPLRKHDIVKSGAWHHRRCSFITYLAQAPFLVKHLHLQQMSAPSVFWLWPKFAWPVIGLGVEKHDRGTKYKSSKASEKM